MREMKDSGVEWIGDIPKIWRILSMKTVLLQNDGGVWGEDPSEDGDDTVVLRSTEQTVDGKWAITEPAHRDLSSINNLDYYRCKAGDLLITKSSGSDLHIGKTTIVDEEIEQMNCCYSNFIQRIRVRKSIEPRLIWYLFNSSIVREQFVFMQNTTSGIGNLNAKYISEIRVPMSDYKTQNRIVKYLDSKCSKIDEIIAKQEQIIEKLKEYKLSVITEAVTKGLNPDGEMKDSGIDWIGFVPADWQIMKVKNIYDYIESGVSVNAGNEPATEGEYGVLKTSSVSKFEFDIQENKSVNRDEMERVGCPVCRNTIIVSRMNTPELVGACGYVEESRDNIFLPDRLWQVHFKEKLNVKYIWYYLRSENIRYYYSSLSMGTSSSMQNISQGDFLNAYIPLPPSDCQDKIVEYLDRNLLKNKKEVLIRKKFIEKLKEYKKSLIYEVVTGKKEV
ncbi:type I restriction enzyme, S subunit [Lachnospiraceae bacterium XPB1003]|nr:type I restriction enzyme, S subunit [Lachnospiraceae bacterium XPB1003]